MYNIVFRCTVSATVKLYSNTIVQPLPLFKKFKFPVHKYAIFTRGYKMNRSMLVNKEYHERCERELEEFLKVPKNAAKYEKYKAEVEYLENTLGKVPKNMKACNWLHLLNTETKAQRRSFLAYLWQIEKKSDNQIKKKELKQKSLAEQKNSKISENEYYMSANTMFHRIRDQTIMNYHNHKLINAMLYSPQVVFDLGYDKYMTRSEQMQCAKQLLFAFSENRLHDDPFNLYFCNANTESLAMQQLHRTIPTIYDPDFPLNITSKSYLEIFDKSKLIYLTPHTKKIMTHFEPDAVYIIGAMIDKTNHEPLSMQKARKEDIKMVKFPLSEKLEWGTGSQKTLPLNHVLSILLDLHKTNDWDIALQNIPKRKLRAHRMMQLVQKINKREQLINTLLEKM